MRRHQFKPEHVEVAFASEKKARWEFKGHISRGLELLYEVKDLNYASRRDWTFMVRVPAHWGGDSYISISPLRIANREIWAGLDRRSLQFARGTIGRHRGRAYAKLSIADVTGEKNRRVLSTEDRSGLPSWLYAFRPVAKRRVIRSGRDEASLVAVSDKKDYPRMIRLFLALKAWVLDREYNPDEATKRPREVPNKELKGLDIVVTGRLGKGLRYQVFTWLRKLGAKPRRDVSSNTDLLIVGAHWQGDDRIKIRSAGRLGIRQYSEAAFRRKFNV
jgi:hypothetical protein